MPPDNTTREKLQACLQRVVDRGVPGISAAIATSNGQCWSSTAGLADIDGGIVVSGEHNFGIGSITKLFMSVVILQLIDEGRLGLEAPVCKHLSKEVWQGIPHAERATISSLMRHTSGIPSWEDDPRWIMVARGADLNVEKRWTESETLDYVRYDNTLPDPDEFHYSNSNFTILGLIAQSVTKRSAADLIRERVIDPLRLDRTYLDSFEPPRTGVTARRYHWLTPEYLSTAGRLPNSSSPATRADLVDVSDSNLSTEWVAGGIISHPLDLCAFALAIRHAKILPTASLETMRSGFTRMERGGWMGHSIMKEDRGEDGIWLGHTGDVLGFAGSVWWSEDRDVAVAVLGNVGTMHAGKVASASSAIRDEGLLSLALRLSAEFTS